LDTALGAVAALSHSAALDPAAEAQAVARILMRDSNVLLIAKHFGASPRFVQHLAAALAVPAAPLDVLGALPAATAPVPATTAPMPVTPAMPVAPAMPDALVVGTGVAGLTAALRLLDAGANVVLMDKERRTGGNSAKASSGINAVLPSGPADSVDAFAADTARSAKRPADGLIGLLAASSADAVRWLMDRTGIDLSRVAQLGGHSSPRTHRPASGMVGSELTVALSRAVRKFEATGQLRMMLGCRVTELRVDQSTGRVTGVSYVDTSTGEQGFVAAHDTVLATGGFANDRTNTSLLAKHRPDLVHFPTTNGPWATGDGMKMAMAIGAGAVDMDKVQIHPTGFLDPSDLAAPAKTLCGEMMRGVGGVLLTPAGHRLVNELLPRDQVVSAELESGSPEFVLLLNQPMATEAGKHVEHYLHKGLLVKLDGTLSLARWMLANADKADAETAEQAMERAARVDAGAAAALQSIINETLAAYNAAAEAGVDEFGKTAFRHAPILPEETLYAGRIVPVLHYTMGGIRMGADGAVLRDDGSVIPGLHAAGEVNRRMP
jgi:flavocytochrome c